MANRAAWIREPKQHPLQVDDAPMPTPGPRQMLVKNHAVAFNPVDPGIQRLGILVAQYPSILGEDLAGEVIAVGSEVTRFQPGDRIVGTAGGIDFTSTYSGSFQLYSNVNENFAARIPADLSYTKACVLPLALCTAVMSIHGLQNLALPHPQLKPAPLGKVVVIWGGSTSVGSCAVQLARAAGAEVATVSGAQNLQYCRDLGAEYVFDYRSATVVEDIVAALQGKVSAGVMCAVQDNEATVKCGEIASRLGGNKFVASVKAPLGHHQIPEEMPADVKVGLNMSMDIGKEPCGAAVWEDWLPSALESGQMKCKPEPEVVGKGLEKVQEAMDLMSQGVSAKKLVVEL